MSCCFCPTPAPSPSRPRVEIWPPAPIGHSPLTRSLRVEAKSIIVVRSAASNWPIADWQLPPGQKSDWSRCSLQFKHTHTLAAIYHWPQPPRPEATFRHCDRWLARSFAACGLMRRRRRPPLKLFELNGNDIIFSFESSSSRGKRCGQQAAHTHARRQRH